MPRRSGGGRPASPSRGLRTSAPPKPASSRVPARTASSPTVPAHPPASQPAAAAQPQQPGMFAQMATTAAGVAVGSAVGHTMGAALTGSMGGGGGNSDEVAAPASYQQTAGSHGALNDAGGGSVCQFELRQFLECSQTQHDLSLCQAFNEALRDCRRANGLMMQ